MFRAFILLITTLLTSPVYAVLFDENGNVVNDVADSNLQTLLYKNVADRVYSAVGSEISESGCTSWVVDNGGGPDAPVYVVFAGHCQYYKANDITENDARHRFLLPNDLTLLSLTAEDLSHGPTRGIWSGHEMSDFTYFDLRFFDDVYNPESNQQTENADQLRFSPWPKKIAYWTMTGIDIIIYETEASKADLIEANIQPLKIASSKPALGEKLEIVTSFYQQMYHRYLQKAHCSKGEDVTLREHTYTFNNVFRHQCSASSGSSGAPILNENHEVVGMHFTSVHPDVAAAQCSLFRPCELGKGGEITVNNGQNYAINLIGLNNCFDQNGLFLIDLEGCPLQ